ncbi:MAG: Carboxypeptidase regulatory-like domain, partial [Acidobacteriota bacterium]
MRVFGSTLALLAALSVAFPAAAQPARDARVIVTVLDATGSFLPGATVTVTPLEAAGAPGVTVTANDQGQATIPGLKPGRYSIKAEFSGFDPGEVSDVRLRAGDNRQQVELALTAFEDIVEVGVDAQANAADPNSTLATSLTQEE